jgi:hypothetical protein
MMKAAPMTGPNDGFGRLRRSVELTLAKVFS